MLWQIKRNDLEPPFRAQCRVRGAGVDLAGKTVRFLMRDQATGAIRVQALAHVMTEEERGEAGIPASELGWVEYAWQTGDTAVAGTYRVEIEVTDGGRARTFPAGGYVHVHVVADLGPEPEP